MKFNIPVSEAPPYRINRFIKAESIVSPTKEMHSKQLSDDEITTQIENCLTKLSEDEEFSGAVMVSKNEKILVKKAFGKASKTYDVPNQIDTKI